MAEIAPHGSVILGAGPSRCKPYRSEFEAPPGIKKRGSGVLTKEIGSAAAHRGMAQHLHTVVWELSPS